jgi:large subunit ribosomal protein L25
MAETKALTATVRSGTGKGAARSVRREGRIPAVIYGGGDPAEPIALDYRELNKLIYAGHFLTTIFEIDLGGSKQRVIPRDYQLDPIKDLPLHVDFLRLKPGTSLRMDVPVHFINQDISPGLKKGGSLNIVRHFVEMRVPAEAIPDSITVDLSNLDIAESLHISAVLLPEGCKPTVAERDFTIVTIVPPLTAAETPAAAAVVAAPAAAAPAKAEAPKAKPKK